MTYNKCQKPLTTTLFVVACNCVFCVGAYFLFSHSLLPLNYFCRGESRSACFSPFPASIRNVKKRLTSMCTLLPLLFSSSSISVETDCTYDHFGADSNCPCCRKEATEEDFMELHIADPSMDKSAKKETATCFQNMFTKHSTSARAVSQADAVRHLMKSVDDNSRMMRFLVKQLVMASTSHGARSVENGRACARFKDEVSE